MPVIFVFDLDTRRIVVSSWNTKIFRAGRNSDNVGAIIFICEKNIVTAPAHLFAIFSLLCFRLTE